MGLGNIGDYIDENWHGGQIDGDFYEHPEIPIEENNEVAKEAKSSVWNWKHAMIRELMRGHHTCEILIKYMNVMRRFNVISEIRNFLNKYDGLIGWLVVDVSNFDEKFKYEDIPAEMRSSNLYAINATELREIISRSLISENDGTMDGLLNFEDSVDEKISYVDECTGLPCIDSLDGDFDDDERMNAVAELFFNRKWITFSEKEAFAGMDGKLAFLASAVNRKFKPKSRSNGKVEDDVKQFDVKEQDLDAGTQDVKKDVDVVNVHEASLDDIGEVKMPEKIDFVQELNKSDFSDDVEFDTPLNEGDVDLDEMFDETHIKDEIEVDDVKEDMEISNKYDWSW